jgi:hypothetical protein
LQNYFSVIEEHDKRLPANPVFLVIVVPVKEFVIGVFNGVASGSRAQLGAFYVGDALGATGIAVIGSELKRKETALCGYFPHHGDCLV